MDQAKLPPQQTTTTNNTTCTIINLFLIIYPFILLSVLLTICFLRVTVSKWETVFLVSTNLFIIPAVWLGFDIGKSCKSALTSIEMIYAIIVYTWSSIYHLCDNNPEIYNSFSAVCRHSQYLDFIFSYLCVAQSILLFAELKPFRCVKLPISIIISIALVLTITIAGILNHKICITVSVGVPMIVTVICILYRWYREKKEATCCDLIKYLLNNYDWCDGAVMLILIIIACVGQFGITNVPYWIRHGLLWHGGIMFGMLFAFECLNQKRILLFFHVLTGKGWGFKRRFSPGVVPVDLHTSSDQPPPSPLLKRTDNSYEVVCNDGSKVYIPGFGGVVCNQMKDWDAWTKEIV